MSALNSRFALAFVLSKRLLNVELVENKEAILVLFRLLVLLQGPHDFLMDILQ